MHPRLTCFSGLCLCLKLSALFLLLTLFLAGCGFLDSSSRTHTSTPATRTTGNSTPTTLDQTASNTSTPTAAATQRGTPPKANATPAPVPFKVAGVSFGTWPGDHQGVCRSNTFFTASVLIYAPAGNTGGAVTYTWLWSDTSTITPGTVTFAAGTTSSMVTALWSLSAYQGNGSAYWVAFKTLSPVALSTPQITYHHTCERQVQSISATVSPASGCTKDTKTFTFSATISVSPGPSNVLLTYTWKRSNGTSGTTTTVNVPQSAPTVTLLDRWSLTAPITKGTSWEELFVTAPNSVLSNQSTFDIISC